MVWRYEVFNADALTSPQQFECKPSFRPPFSVHVEGPCRNMSSPRQPGVRSGVMPNNSSRFWNLHALSTLGERKSKQGK